MAKPSDEELMKGKSDRATQKITGRIAVRFGVGSSHQVRFNVKAIQPGRSTWTATIYGWVDTTGAPHDPKTTLKPFDFVLGASKTLLAEVDGQSFDVETDEGVEKLVTLLKAAHDAAKK